MPTFLTSANNDGFGPESTAVAVERRDRRDVVFFTLSFRSCGIAFSTASEPAFSAAWLGGNHNGYQ